LSPDFFNLKPSTFNSSSPNGGFVPDFAKGRSFVINQIGGFVFQEFSVLRRCEVIAKELPTQRHRGTEKNGKRPEINDIFM